MVARVVRNLHWIASLSLLLAVVPLARYARIPLRYPWQSFAAWSWGFAVNGALIAAMVYLLSFPERFRTGRAPATGASQRAWGVAAPLLYFVPGFLLVLTYNDIFAALRFDDTADARLAKADRALLLGHSVAGWAHSVLGAHPWMFWPVEFTYLLLFSLVAACIVTVGATDGADRALQLVGAILLAYYVSLAAFWLIPATGPYLGDHALPWPHDSQVYAFEMAAGIDLPNFARGFRPSEIGSDYFVGLPCMHVVQPLIMLWFLRRNRAWFWLLSVYTALLIPCIFLLEEHYVVDVLVAIPVAALAVWVSQRS